MHADNCSVRVRVVVFLMLMLIASTLGSARVEGQYVIAEIIDATGDGAAGMLDRPVGVAVDPAGNVYVCGFFSSNAFKITPGGEITEIIDAAGDGAGNGLSLPQGIAVDEAGNVYVAGITSHNAFKITPGGVITEIIDSTGDGAGNLLNQPAAIAVDDMGNVFVAGRGTHNAFKISPGGVITEIIDSNGDGQGNSLNGPFAIALDGDGKVYLAGQGSHNAFKITPGGVITQIIDFNGDGAGNLLLEPNGLAVDDAGNAFVTGVDVGPDATAFKITPAGVITEIIDGTGDGAGNPLIEPIGIVADAAGNVFLTGHLSSNAFRITPGGIITEIIDATGDGAGHGLGLPFGIAGDTAGNIYITGSESDNAFKLAPRCDAGVCPDGTTALVDPEGDFAGWCVGSSDPAHTDTYVDNVVPGSHALIEVSKDFVAQAPITLTFHQVCADDSASVPMILIADESLTNLTGVEWPDFAWQLTGDHAWFDVAASALFSVSPFATKTWDDFLDAPINQQARALRASDGAVPPFSSFFPGHGTGSLKIAVDLAASDAPLFFELVETSSAIHVTGDFDADADIDLHDFAIFGQCFGGSGRAAAPACAACDLDADGDVDTADFALFAQRFGGVR